MRSGIRSRAFTSLPQTSPGRRGTSRCRSREGGDVSRTGRSVARERGHHWDMEDSMNRNGFRRSWTSVATKSRLSILSFLAVLLAFSAAAQALAQELDTIEPGKLIVGFNGDMPMTSLKDGQLIGSDGKMIAKI